MEDQQWRGFLHDESSWPHGSDALVSKQLSRLGDSGETLCSSEPRAVIGQPHPCRSLTDDLHLPSSPQLPRLIYTLPLRLIVSCVVPSDSIISREAWPDLLLTRHQGSDIVLLEASSRWLHAATLVLHPTSSYTYAIQDLHRFQAPLQFSFYYHLLAF